MTECAGLASPPPRLGNTSRMSFPFAPVLRRLRSVRRLGFLGGKSEVSSFCFVLFLRDPRVSFPPLKV